MKRIIILLAIFQCLGIGEAIASTQLTNQERAIVYVISQEAADFALESRTDVCVGFSTDLSTQESKILAALRDKGLNFHPNSWCNHGPRGVTILITMPNREAPQGTYEINSGINDSDPIRLYGDHFGTMLRKSTYILRCNDDSEPALVAYHLICCEKEKLIPEKTQLPN